MSIKKPPRSSMPKGVGALTGMLRRCHEIPTQHDHSQDRCDHEPEWKPHDYLLYVVDTPGVQADHYSH